MPSINKLLVNIDQNLSQAEKKQALANLGITTTSGDVGKSLTVQDEGGTLGWSELDIFVAEYSQTTFKEINKAYDSNKTIFLKKVEAGAYRDIYIPLCYRTAFPGRKRKYYFITPDNLLRISINEDNGWKVEDLGGFNWKEELSGSSIGTENVHVSDTWSDSFHGDFNGRWLNASGTGDHLTPIFITGDGQNIGVPAKCSAKFVYSVDVNGNLIDQQYKLCMDGSIGTASGVIYCL